MLSGVTQVALTKIDVLNGLETLKVCTKYMLNGEEIDYFPSDIEDVKKCKPIYIELEGWKEIQKNSSKISDLPMQARNYIKYIEKFLETKISIVSIGPGRKETIEI